MKLWELVDKNLFEQMVRDKFINIRSSNGLSVAKYSDSATYNRMWNDATKVSRGIIFDQDYNIVARGYDKFFNYNEPMAAQFDISDKVLAMEKVDGSLGIVFYNPLTKSVQVSTAGSLQSEQAIWATEFINTKYENLEELTRVLQNGWSALVEIIYPDNRIVVDYGDKQDLVLLGFRHMKGYFISPKMVKENKSLPWSGTICNYAEIFFNDVLNMVCNSRLAGNEAEGFVCYKPTTGELIKVKYEAYLQAHRIIYGITLKQVVETLQAGKYEELKQSIPEEFYGLLDSYYDTAMDYFSTYKDKVLEHINTVYATVGENVERKDYALWIKQNIEKPYNKPVLDVVCAKRENFDNWCWKQVLLEIKEV